MTEREFIPLYYTETFTYTSIMKYYVLFLDRKHWKYRLYKWWHKFKFRAKKFIIFYLKA